MRPLFSDGSYSAATVAVSNKKDILFKLKK